MDEGMLPLNSLFWRLSVVKLKRLPNDGGIVPVSHLRLKSTVVARCGVPLTVMPSHVVMALL